MDNKRTLLTVEQAIEMLPNTDHIHTYRSAGFIILGADWERDKLLEAIKAEGAQPQLAGENATEMGHGLAVWVDGDWMFVETAKQDGER